MGICHPKFLKFSAGTVDFSTVNILTLILNLFLMPYKNRWNIDVWWIDVESMSKFVDAFSTSTEIFLRFSTLFRCWNFDIQIARWDISRKIHRNVLQNWPLEMGMGFEARAALPHPNHLSTPSLGDCMFSSGRFRIWHGSPLVWGARCFISVFWGIHRGASVCVQSGKKFWHFEKGYPYILV